MTLKYRYWIVPSGTQDIYAAGFEGNGFDALVLAKKAADGMAAAGPEFAETAWVVWDSAEGT